MVSATRQFFSFRLVWASGLVERILYALGLAEWMNVSMQKLYTLLVIRKHFPKLQRIMHIPVASCLPAAGGSKKKYSFVLFTKYVICKTAQAAFYWSHKSSWHKEMCKGRKRLRGFLLQAPLQARQTYEKHFPNLFRPGASLGYRLGTKRIYFGSIRSYSLLKEPLLMEAVGAGPESGGWRPVVGAVHCLNAFLTHHMVQAAVLK